MSLPKEDVEKAFLMGDGDHGDDPSIFYEVMSDIDFKKQLDVMKLEIDSMHLNQVWSLVDPSERIIPIGFNESIKRKQVQKVRQRPIRQGWW